MKARLTVFVLIILACASVAPAKKGPTPQFLTAPYLQNIKTDGITIMWETAQQENCYVEYGLTPRYGNTQACTSVISGGDTVVYKSRLTGLSAATTYNYRVIVGHRSSIDNTFTTAPADEVDFSFGVWADSQGGEFEPTYSLIADMAQNVDIAVACGDIAAGEQNSYLAVRLYFLDRVAANLGPASVPYYVAWGNHDIQNGNAMDFVDHPKEEGNFSFDYSGCHFICIVDDYKRDYSWMESDLQQAVAGGARHIFLFVHRPPYCERWIDGEEEFRERLVPLLEQYGVDACFSGHTHEYERGHLNNVYYCITGGGSWLDIGEPLICDWPHMTVGGCHDLGPNVEGGLVNEYVRVDVTSSGFTATMIPFYSDGTRRTDVTDAFGVVTP
jgi:predicted phosphodiesterase